MQKKLHISGEIVSNSGIYRQVGPRGGKTNIVEFTFVEGSRFSPTVRKGNRFVLYRKTRHTKTGKK